MLRSLHRNLMRIREWWQLLGVLELLMWQLSGLFNQRGTFADAWALCAFLVWRRHETSTVLNGILYGIFTSYMFDWTPFLFSAPEGVSLTKRSQVEMGRCYPTVFSARASEAECFVFSTVRFANVNRKDAESFHLKRPLCLKRRVDRTGSTESM